MDRTFKMTGLDASSDGMSMLFHGLVDQVSDAFYMHDSDGHFVEVNLQACSRLGYSKAELLRLSIADVTPDDDLKKARAEWTKMEPGDAFMQLGHQKRKDGTVFPVEVRYGCILWKDQKLFFCLARDLSDRVKTEEILRESEERFRRMVEGAPDGIFIQVDRKFAYLNSAMCDLIGIDSPAEILGRPILEFIHPDFQTTAAERIRQLNEDREPVFDRFELVFLKMNGDEVWVETSGEPIVYQQKNGALVFARDISERISARENQRRSEEKFRSVFEAANVGKSITDLDGRIFANEAFARMLGYSRAELSQITWQMLTPPEEVEAIERETRLLVSGKKESTRFNKRYIHKNGSHVWADVSVALQRDENGAPKYFITTIVDISERRRMEQALLESEERFRMSTQLADVAVWEFDFRTNTMARSPNHDLLYGLEQQDVWYFETFVEATHPDDREYSNQMIMRSAAPGGPDRYQFDFRVVYPDQSIHWLSVVGFVIERDAEGRAVIVRGALTDITERKRAEETLQKSEQKFSTLFRKASIPAALSKLPENVFVDVNDAWQMLFGFDREEVIGKTAAEIGVLRNSKIGALIVEADFQDPVSDNLELTLSTKSGEPVTVLINANVVEIDGQPHIVTSLQDITARKQAEIALHESEERYRNILFVAPVGIAVHQNGKIVYTNPAGLRILGADSYDQVIGKPISNFIHSDRLRQAQDRIQRMLAGEEGLYPVEDKYLRLDGSTVEVEVTATSLSYHGQPAVQVIVSDISERKRNREALIRLNLELEDRVRERTAQLESSNQELEAFAYSVSHDLRAPLRGIDGFSRILEQEYEKYLDVEGRRYLRIIRSSTQRMDQLITDLLALSRVGRTQLVLEPVSMTQMVSAVYNEIAAPSAREKIDFIVSDLPDVVADRTLIRQVWANLISNAIKYTLPKDDCRIEVGGRCEEGQCVYRIRDNGVGYNPKYEEQLFHVFQRLHKESEFEGTGVGLAIVQRIVQRHGGQVWSEGEVGKGATFSFSIPQSGGRFGVEPPGEQKGDA
ncbi:MAG: PAS domain S-box protein [Anaerolineaceae bacterium]|nr:PAS domain S-box protein [Anaerolineaceae bacterium]